MKIVSTDIRIVDNDLLIDGKYRFGDTLRHAQDQEPVTRQAGLTAGLPPDDLAPGHVLPAIVVPISRSV